MSNDKELYQFVKASERLPDIDNENPKHYLFLNEVNHHAIDIWTEFITNFPPLITTRLFDWKWLSPAPPSGEDAVRLLKKCKSALGVLSTMCGINDLPLGKKAANEILKEIIDFLPSGNIEECLREPPKP